MKTTVSSEHSCCLGLLSAPQGEGASCVCVCVCARSEWDTARVRAPLMSPCRAGGISHQGCRVPWQVSGLLMLGRFLPAPLMSPQGGLGPASHQNPLVLQICVFLASSSHCFSLLQHPTPLHSRKAFPGPWHVTCLPESSSSSPHLKFRPSSPLFVDMCCRGQRATWLPAIRRTAGRPR